MGIYIIIVYLCTVCVTDETRCNVEKCEERRRRLSAFWVEQTGPFVDSALLHTIMSRYRYQDKHFGIWSQTMRAIDTSCYHTKTTYVLLTRVEDRFTQQTTAINIYYNKHCVTENTNSKHHANILAKKHISKSSQRTRPKFSQHSKLSAPNEWMLCELVSFRASGINRCIFSGYLRINVNNMWNILGVSFGSFL